MSFLWESFSIYCKFLLSSFDIWICRVFGKSIFPGKTYNDILAQNRACNFDFNDPLYDKLSPLGNF